MSRREFSTIYDKNHPIQVYNRSGFIESRTINFNISDFFDHIQIKIRDGGDFVFNYTINIDLREFEKMRSEQSLDIDFQEFKANLLELLQQVQRNEMYLKCEIDANNSSMVFYTKSKIKSIIHLKIDLNLTNQTEIFDEMNKTILELQTVNKNLNSQLQITKNVLQEKDGQVKSFSSRHKQLEVKFINELTHLGGFFQSKLQETSKQLLEKLLTLTKRLLKLIQDVEIVKTEAILKSDSSKRLLQSMESLRIEGIEATRLIDEIKRENCNLKHNQVNNDTMLAELNRTVQKQRAEYEHLEKLKNELERDVKQATLIIAQKATANEELAKDVVQANQMLVNFNHLFDTKNQEISDLKAENLGKEHIINEQKRQFDQLRHEYEEYQTKFNPENMNQLSHELFVTNKRVEELEKSNRETVKLNELLTRKLASSDFPRSFR